MDWAGLTYQDTARAGKVWQPDLLSEPQTMACVLFAVCLKECWRLGLMSHEEFRRATDLAAIRGDNSAAGRVLTVEELVLLFRACAQDESVMGIRDAAILATLYSTGLSRSEAVGFERGRLPGRSAQGEGQGQQDSVGLHCG